MVSDWQLSHGLQSENKILLVSVIGSDDNKTIEIECQKRMSSLDQCACYQFALIVKKPFLNLYEYP